MKYCTQCGEELVDGARFCSSCGAPVGEGSAKSESSTVKCPQCGERIDAFVAKCPACGHELRGMPAVRSLRDLMDRLRECDEGTPRKRGLFERVWHAASPADDYAATLIREHPIPNTKEDLIEFLVVASSNVDPDAFNGFKQAEISPSEAIRSRAWMAKLEQAYQKALLVLDDDELARCESLYNKTSKKVLHAKRAFIYFWICWTVIMLFLIALGTVLVPK